MRRRTLYALCISLLLIGCTADQASKTELWLARPVSTQPNSPSNEQAIQGTVNSVGGFTGPWGTFAATLVNLGLIAFHEYSSRKRIAATQELVVATSPKV